MMEEKKTAQLWFAHIFLFLWGRKRQGNMSTHEILRNTWLIFALCLVSYENAFTRPKILKWSDKSEAFVLNVLISSAVISCYSFQAVLSLAPVIQRQPDPFFRFHKMHKLATVLGKKNTFVYWLSHYEDARADEAGVPVCLDCQTTFWIFKYLNIFF